MKTLQQQYLLIKEGKGNKDHFLKQARNLFPEYITSGNDYNSATQILKGKGILSEAIGGVVTMNPNSKPDWFKIFDTNLKEAVGVKNTKEYGNQNEFEKVEKEVQDDLDHNFDNKDEKNIDNVYGQSFLMGYYTEMKDPKNADKTVDELKQIVLKNMVKDVTYYNTKASFGVKDIGYTKDVVGGGDPVAPKGKHKSSGYGDMPKTKVVKEGKDKTISSKVENLADKVVKWYEKHPNPKMKERINSVEKTLENLMSKTIGKDAISYNDFEKQIKNKFNLPFEDPQYSKFKKSSLNESYDDMYGVDGEDENEAIRQRQKTYAVYELSFGQPYNFYNEEKNEFIWDDPKQATLYTKEEAELKRRELLKPRIDYYQRTGNNYKEIHTGDLYKKNILREGKDEDKIAKYEKYTYTLDGETVTPDDIAFYNNLLGAELDGKVYKMGIPDENGNVELNTSKGKTGMYTESKHGDEADLKIYKSELNLINKTKASGEKQLKRKADLEKKIADLEKKQTESLNEAKKSNVHSRIKDLEKQNEVLALESKIAALDEAINELNQKVSLSESDDLAEMMDPKKINELKKDIKVLEKYKVTCEKKLSKLGGKKPVVDNEEIKENTASVGKNYPGTLTAEFDGEEQVLDGQDLHDFLTTILTASNDEDDFISKVEYGLTNTNSKLDDEDVESLKNWYNANQ